MTRNTLLSILFTLLVVSTLGASVASPVVAQSESSNTTVPTPSNPIGSESGNDSSNVSNESGNESGSGGIGNWVSNATPSVGNPVPSPWEAIQEILTSAYEDMKGAAEGYINDLNFVLLGLPAPGEPFDPASWFSPDDDMWSHVLGVYAMMSGIAVVLLVIATQFALGMDDMKRQRKLYRKIAKAFFIGPLAGVPVMALALHGGNAITMALTPSGKELLMDFGELSNLGLGVILGATLAKFKIGAIFLGLIILVVIYFTILLIAAAWPALWAMTVTPFPTLQSWGEAGILTFGKLIILRATQGFILRVTFALPWGSLGEATLIITMIGTLGGICLAFLGLPYYVLRKVTIASAMSLGMSGVSTTAAGNAPRKVRSGASQLRSRIQESRSTDTPTPSKSRGDVKQRAYSGSSKAEASSSSRSVGSFGGSSRSGSSSSSKLSLMQSKRNADRAAKTRADD